MQILETTRLVLHPFTDEDCEFILELLNEEAFLRYVGDKGVRTLEDARTYIQRGPQASYNEQGFGLYRVDLKETGEPIGMCGLLQRDTLEYPDMGFALLERFWGNGYASESASAVRKFGKNELALDRIDAITSPDNHTSIGLLEKIGFQFKKRVVLANGEPEVKLFSYEHTLGSNMTSRRA